MQWKKREGTKAYRDILSFLTLFSIFLEVICGERVYLGRPPRVDVRPSSRGKRMWQMRWVFLAFWPFFMKSNPNEKGAPAL